MITRAQAEALLTLAESLEACERVGVSIYLNQTDCDCPYIGFGGEPHFFDNEGVLHGETFRRATAQLIPQKD